VIKERKTVKKNSISDGVLYPAVLGVCAGSVPLSGNEHTHSAFGNCTAEKITILNMHFITDKSPCLVLMCTCRSVPFLYNYGISAKFKLGVISCATLYH
jgi:hypothetical protein